MVAVQTPTLNPTAAGNAPTMKPVYQFSAKPVGNQVRRKEREKAKQISKTRQFF